MYLIDLHTHTISSGHAYSTIQENVVGAKNNQIKILGMSDHARSLPGAPHPFHFLNLRVIPDYIDGVRVLKGIEANIIDFQGTIDVPGEMLKKMDYVIASLHPPVIEPSHLEDNTNTLLKVMENDAVKIIGHPDDGRYPIDYEQMVLKAKATKTLIEINNASLTEGGSRVDTIKHSTTILELCKKHKVHVIFGSDAHISFDVGNFANCLKLKEKVDFPEALIVNTSAEKLFSFLNI